METTIESTTTTTVASDKVAVPTLAQILGEDERRLTLKEVDWSVYAQRGVIVKISIGLCNWATKMKLEDWGLVDLDDEERKAYERTCSFGYRNLLPREGFIDPCVAIAGRGRAAVEEFGVRASCGWFVPVARYKAWRARNDQLMAQFLACRDDLEANWDVYVQQMDDDYMTVARRNYRALAAQGVKLELSAEEYGLQALARSKRRVQTKEAALAAFRWEWEVSEVPFDPTAEQAYRNASAKGDVLQADLSRTRMQREAGGLDTFVKDVTEQVRGEVYRVVVEALAALRKNGGKLPPATTGQLRTLFTTVQEMMFWPDAELESKLEDVKSLIDVQSEQRNVPQIEGVLQELGREMRSYLLEIKRPPARSGAEFGIPDDRKSLAAAKRRKPAALTALPASDIAAPAPRKGKRAALAPVDASGPVYGPEVPEGVVLDIAS